MEIKFIDMFCGIGGFRLGLENTSFQANRGSKEDPQGKYEEGEGLHAVQSEATRDKKRQSGELTNRGINKGQFTCVWSNDNDKYACEIYRKHFEEVCEQDIRTVDADAISEHDLLCAGFPCQSFSIAGQQGGFQDTRGTLFFEICRVLRVKRPSLLLLENVKGLLSDNNGETFYVILRNLERLGYDCQWQVLNSKDFGVPQNRERVFIVGHLRGKPRPKVFPLGEICARAGESYAERTQTDISPTIDGRVGATTHWGTYVVQAGIRTKGKPRFYKDEVPAMAQAYGTGGGNVPMIAQRHRGIRRLTPLECERLQGFPDGWTTGISDSQRYKCLGNAITVNVVEAIGRQLLGSYY